MTNPVRVIGVLMVIVGLSTGAGVALTHCPGVVGEAAIDCETSSHMHPWTGGIPDTMEAPVGWLPGGMVDVDLAAMTSGNTGDIYVVSPEKPGRVAGVVVRPGHSPRPRANLGLLREGLRNGSMLDVIGGLESGPQPTVRFARRDTRASAMVEVSLHGVGTGGALVELFERGRTLARQNVPGNQTALFSEAWPTTATVVNTASGRVFKFQFKKPTSTVTPPDCGGSSNFDIDEVWVTVPKGPTPASGFILRTTDMEAFLIRGLHEAGASS